MAAVRLISAESNDLERYLELLEEVADWLAIRGIKQWRPGNFRGSAAYYAESIKRKEVQLAFVGDQLVGTLRLLLREPIVWPEITDDDAVYVYNLAVKRTWTGHELGRRLLELANDRALSLGRQCVRLDCIADNAFLRNYYTRAGFEERGEVVARFPEPVGTLQLRRYEKSTGAQSTAAQHANGADAR